MSRVKKIEKLISRGTSIAALIGHSKILILFTMTMTHLILSLYSFFEYFYELLSKEIHLIWFDPYCLLRSFSQENHRF